MSKGTTTLDRNPSSLGDVLAELTNLSRLAEQMSHVSVSQECRCEMIGREASARRDVLEAYCLTLKPESIDDVADMLRIIDTRLDQMQGEVATTFDNELRLIRRGLVACFQTLRDDPKGGGGFLNEAYGVSETWSTAAERAVALFTAQTGSSG